MKKILFLFACLGLLISCSDDNEAPGHEIHGLWTVTEYIVAAPTSPAIEEGKILWTIDIDNKKLKVKSQSDIMESGTYDITVARGIMTIHYPDFDEELKYSFEGELLVFQSADTNVVGAAIVKLKKFSIVPQE